MSDVRADDLKTTSLPGSASVTPLEISEHLSNVAIKAVLLFSRIPLKITWALTLAEAVANFGSVATVKPFGVLYGCNLGVQLPCYQSKKKLFVKAHEQTADTADGITFGQVL